MFNTPFHGNDLKCFPHHPLKYPPLNQQAPLTWPMLYGLYISGLRKMMKMPYF